VQILKLSKKAYKQYTSSVKENEDTGLDQAARKLTRNVQIVKEKVEKHRWMKDNLVIEGTLSTTYCYGSLHIKVRNGKVVGIKNHQEDKNFEFFVPKKRYIQLSRQLGIEGYESKFGSKYA